MYSVEGTLSTHTMGHATDAIFAIALAICVAGLIAASLHLW